STSRTRVRRLPQASEIGDEAELWGKHDEGWQPWEVNDTINNVIEDAVDSFFIAVETDIATPYNRDAGTIAIPDLITRGVVSLSYQSRADDAWYPVHEQADEEGDS